MKKILLFSLVSVIISACFILSCSKTETKAQNDVNPSMSAKAPESKAFEGDFIYFADSANFSNYATTKSYPVAMEGAYLDVEKAYTAFNFAEPMKVYLQVEGYLENRPGMEDGTTNETLIITKMIGFDTNKQSKL